MVDNVRTRFTDIDKIRNSLAQGMPEVFDSATIERLKREVEGLPYGHSIDITLALASEHAGIGAVILRRLLDPKASVGTMSTALIRGRQRLKDRRSGKVPGPKRGTLVDGPRG